LRTRAHTVPKFYLAGFASLEAAREPFVWIGFIKTGEIIRRSPRNVATTRGLYDGPGGFSDPGASIEAHLAQIESDAAIAIREMSINSPTAPAIVSPAIWRFLAWQAARTPEWMVLVQHWTNDELGHSDLLTMTHMQAHEFQATHFPKFCWTKLIAPEGEYFITSSRGVSWIVDGYADTPPAALRDPMAQIVAPLTRSLALVGRYAENRLNVTPRDVNRSVAFLARDWIAGSTQEVVRQALADRRVFVH